MTRRIIKPIPSNNHMTNATKYVVVIGFLVLLGGVGVYGMRSLQNNQPETATVATNVTPKAAVSASPSPVAATSDPAAATPSADLDAQNAAFTSEGADSGSSIDASNPMTDPTPTDTSGTDSVLANE